MYYILALLFFMFPNMSYSQENKTEEIKNVNYASVIMYHRFGDSRYPSTNIKKKQFLEHVNELLKPKYNVINIEQALQGINNVKLIKDKSIVITIDDAYSSVYKKSNQIPDAVWVGKLGLYITKNNINYKSSKIAFDEFKPIYVRSPEIN